MFLHIEHKKQTRQFLQAIAAGYSKQSTGYLEILELPRVFWLR